MMPRVSAYKSSGWNVATDVVAGVNAARLESNREVRDRIAYLSQQDEELLRAKRHRLEESLWRQLEADIGDLFETIEIPKFNRSGEPILDKEGRPVTIRRHVVRDLQTLPPELRHAIESITVDAEGNVTAKLVGKLQVNQALYKMLGFDKQQSVDSKVPRLSNAELVDELARQANELGVHIDLSYKFSEEE